ncbi:oligopeptide transport system ATP-binding protein [Streptoalloteichus tenebrarius]|uniref:Oligopeptide transport system ATP-binding protein n=1 Tax=Streptoalloteichus tenebrarius (strain ATCC 17920 / DSM 40477 / JCM 4838 / CBS 697.72 / NBRC 16177 / NCIMB 11028 / NRRL B-12390 / A12253. 1 / ISP 5477) TaxID=1933 RepID=A0ABT1HRU8_STRSD|nr:oligopeptide/dipeptide ABC transporter ATP-binding protein [Streptoalloteichus tenebrarius]MCP2258249.1 oligopeptide transport system ATP-binding protein [Streptoalloteichus tenebrarius]BFF04521.1 dipeptide ABC transporter ATP-binding protein [Streptoalloteichus tenebrarius]
MSEAVLEVRDVTRHYQKRRPGRPWQKDVVRAVDGIDLTLYRGEALGVVGESGCGKSTLAKLLVALEKPTSGEIRYRGKDINAVRGADWNTMRRNIQLLFQDPYASLDPRKTVANIVGEPFRIHRDLVPKHRIRDRVRELLDMVGLDPDHLDRYPHEFSGGQRQRIGIARGIALNPEILVCDEPVSALDVSVRAQVINLLTELRRELGLTIVFIAHDLDVVRHFSDRVITMYLGRIVEEGPCDAVYDRPSHPYTRALLSAAPRPDFDRPAVGRILLEGDPPSPINPPSGCSFHTRCWMARPECAQQVPPPFDLGDGHTARCLFADEVATANPHR